MQVQSVLSSNQCPIRQNHPTTGIENIKINQRARRHIQQQCRLTGCWRGEEALIAARELVEAHALDRATALGTEFDPVMHQAQLRRIGIGPIERNRDIWIATETFDAMHGLEADSIGAALHHGTIAGAAAFHHPLHLDATFQH